MHFHNLNSIDLNLFDNKIDFPSSITEIILINSDLRFTIDVKTVKAYADIATSRNKTFNSLFQI